MLNNDNIKSTSVSEAVEKIPADEKDCVENPPFCVLLCTAYKEQTNYS